MARQQARRPCGCLLRANAVGAGPQAVDLNYCREVLQEHWDLKCSHGNRATPLVPAALIAEHGPKHGPDARRPAEGERRIEDERGKRAASAHIRMQAQVALQEG